MLVDAQYRRLNAVRADRASGIYLRNFTAQRTTFNAVYILESDGFVIDNDDRPVERRVRVPHLRRRPRALHRLRGVRQRGLRRLPGRRGEHQRRAGPRRRPVRHRDPGLQQPPQPARLLGHGGRLGLGPRQRLHRQHRRGRHRQRVPRPPGPAAEPRAVRGQHHRRQQRGLLPLRPRRHLRQAVRRARVRGRRGLPGGRGAGRHWGDQPRRQLQHLAQQLDLRQRVRRLRHLMGARLRPRRERAERAVRHLAQQPLLRQPHGRDARGQPVAQRYGLLVGRAGRGLVLAGAVGRRRRAPRAAPVRRGRPARHVRHHALRRGAGQDAQALRLCRLRPRDAAHPVRL